MKLRTVISLSLVSLIAVVLIQLGGMLYAFHAQMQEAEKLLNKCFWMFFHSNWLIIRRILCRKNFIFHVQFRCVFHCLEEFFFDIDKISLFNA